MIACTWGQHAGARLARVGAALAMMIGTAATARAAANNGGVAYLSWSLTNTLSALAQMPATTATLYVRIGLVQEIKGIEYTLHWTYANNSGCVALKSLVEAPDEPGCTWAMRGPAVPITNLPDSLQPDRVFIARAVPPEQLSHCSAGTVAGVTFNFANCATLTEGMNFCLESFIAVDGQNAIDTLTIAGDAHIGAGAPVRACGPLPRPRIDRLLPSGALYGTTPTIVVTGFNFLSPSDVRLTRSNGDTLTPTAIAYHNASEVSATFDLSHVPPGLQSLFGTWSLIVRNPDGQGPSPAATFVVKVPAAQIDSIRPATLFSGPGRGRTTTVRFYGRDFFLNPTVPVARIYNASAILPGAAVRLEAPTVLAADFTVPDSLSQLSSADIGDHAFAVTVQNLAASETTISRGIFLYRPAPLLLAVGTTADLTGNRVEWQLDGATSGSRFRVTRQSFRCGVLDRTATVFDSVFTRGTRFHYLDAHPPIGRQLVYSVRHVYLIGYSDSVVAELTSSDSVGTRCSAGDGGGGGGGGGGGTGNSIVLTGSTFHPPASGARILITATAAMTAKAVVYDLRGRRVASVADGAIAAGETEIDWGGRRDDGGEAVAGIYVLRLTVGTTTSTHRLVLVR